MLSIKSCLKTFSYVSGREVYDAVLRAGWSCVSGLPTWSSYNGAAFTHLHPTVVFFFLFFPLEAFICVLWNNKMRLIEQKGNSIFLSISAFIKRLLWGGAACVGLGVRNSFC